MTRHLHACVKYKQISSQVDKSNILHLFENTNAIGHDALPTQGTMTTAKLSEQVLRMIVAGSLSFSFAENPEFVALLKHAYPHCSIPNRRGIVEKLKVNAEVEKKRLKDELECLDSKASLAIDCWSSRNNHAYMGMSPIISFWSHDQKCNGQWNDLRLINCMPVTTHIHTYIDIFCRNYCPFYRQPIPVASASSCLRRA